MSMKIKLLMIAVGMLTMLLVIAAPAIASPIRGSSCTAVTCGGYNTNIAKGKF